MELTTFFEKFELFADAPDAVTKMRELVLDLAMIGKLVEQENKEGNAEKLLINIAEQRKQLHENEGVEPKKITKDTAQLYPIPRNWEWTTLANAGHDLGQEKPSSAISYIDVASIDNKRGKVSNRVEQIEAKKAPSRARKKVRPGTVIYSTVRPYLLNIAIVERDFSPAPIASTAFGILFPYDGVFNRFLFYWLRSKAFTNHVESQMKGMAYPAINDSKFYSAPIPLPPLAEQKRIVAKVDELMALCDQLETQQQKRDTRHTTLARASLARFADTPTPANLNFLFHKAYSISPADLRKSILTLAVQGKLAPQDLNDKPASQGVNKARLEIETSVAEKKIKKVKLPPPAQKEDVTKIPYGWTLSTLPEIANPIPYAIKRGPFGSSIRKDMFIAEGYKVYEQQHAIYGDFSAGTYYLSEDDFNDLRAFELRPFDVIISCSGTVGRVSIAPEDLQPGVINQALLKLSLNQEVLLNQYFKILFPAYFMGLDTLSDLQGTAQKNMPGMDVMKSLRFPLPPLAEQSRILAKVDQLMALVEELETQLAESRATAKNLLEALVAELTAAGASSPAVPA